MNIRPIGIYANYRKNDVKFGSISPEYSNTDTDCRTLIRERIEQTITPQPSDGEQGIANAILNAVLPKKKYAPGKDILSILRNAKIKATTERIKDKLYTGQSLFTYDDAPKVAALKKAGIKTIVCLIPGVDLYEEKAKELSINFLELSQIGSKTLRTKDFGVLNDLANRPGLWNDELSDRKIKDLKKYIDILDGKDKNFPGPVYMGCETGSARTDVWMKIYNLFKDAPRNKPLSQEKLAKLEDLIEYTKYISEYS